jgi:2-hydroxy-3-keto-5-methylthiopentenyl-1-phosphate phosphatase
MEITKKEILEKFTADEMASLLVGAKMRTKTDKDLIAYLLERIKSLEEEMKDVVRNTKRKAKRD